MKKQLLLSALLLNIPILISSAGFTIQNNTDKTIWVTSTLHLPLKDQRLSEKPGTKTKQKVDTKELEVDGKKLLFIEVPTGRQEFIITKSGERTPFWFNNDKPNTIYTTKENSFKNPDLLVIGKKNKAVNNYYLKEAVLGVTKKEHSGNAIEKGIKQEARQESQKEYAKFSNLEQSSLNDASKLEKNIYAIFCISEKATDAEIKKAYRTLSMKYHPDTTTEKKEVAEDMILKINTANEIFKDKKLKNFYDKYYLPYAKK